MKAAPKFNVGDRVIRIHSEKLFERGVIIRDNPDVGTYRIKEDDGCEFSWAYVESIFDSPLYNALK